MARILPNDRLLLVGKTGSGKSTLAAYLFGELRVQRVIVDPKGEWRVRGAALARAPAQLEAALERYGLVRYVPRSGDREEWEEVYRLLFERRRIFVWTDEAYSVSEANWQPRGLRLMQTQGRALGIGHMVCTQRPRNLSRELVTEAEHFFVFTPPLTGSDLDDVAREMGLEREELRAALLELPEHGFLWYDRRLGETTVCQPLPEELRRRAAASARTF